MIWDLLIHIVGPIIGWAWSDVAKAGYEYHLEDDDSQAMSVLKVWLNAGAVTLVAPSLSYGLLTILDYLETTPGQQDSQNEGAPLAANRVGVPTE